MDRLMATKNNRTICLRVAEVVGESTKAEFYQCLRKTLDISRKLANWTLTECVKNDPAWDSLGADKIPKLGKVYTYPKFKHLQQGWSHELSAIARSFEGKYKDIRFDLVLGKKSLPCVRSAPWPLLRSSKSVELIIDGDQLFASIKLIGLNDVAKRFTVRLKRGSNYRDQVAGLIAALKYDGIGDSKIWVDRKGVAVIGFSVQAEQKKHELNHQKKLVVRTSGDSFLLLIRDRSTTPYVINGELLRKKAARKSAVQQRLRQDIKPKQKRRVRRELARVSDTYDRFVKTFVHQVSAQIVSFAHRNKYGVIEFDDAIKSYFKHFAWFDLKQKLEYKCKDHGIEFIHRPTIAFERCDIFDIPTPHVYFAVELDRESKQLTGKMKIGKTTKPTLERMAGIGGQTNLFYEPIAVYESNKSRLTKDEKMFHSQFAEHRVSKDRELFELEPVKTWLRERGAIDD